MHIIIGIITAIAGLVWALNSLQNAGVDLNAFNPFTWIRRRQWARQLGTKPMHALTNSMDAAALLVVAVALLEGEITRDTKLEILQIFEQEFSIQRPRAIELFSASSYLLKDVLNVAAEVRLILAPSKAEFQERQAQTLLAMLNKVATLETAISPDQGSVIKAVELEFGANDKQTETW